MARLFDISEKLDKDGDATGYVCNLEGSDIPVYITRDDFAQIAAAFGYEVVMVLRPLGAE